MLVFACLIGVTSSTVDANTGTAPAIPETAATEGASKPYLYPSMDPANTLAGEALIAALRKGGYMLYMRHTETGTITPMCGVSNLTPRGERDAARVGKALQSLGIPIERIASSPVCRVQDTARNLSLGGHEVLEGLSNESTRAEFDVHAARGKLLATQPGVEKNVLLVSHMHGGNDLSQAIYLDFGEIVVFRPDGKGGNAAVARVRVDEWANLAKVR